MLMTTVRKNNNHNNNKKGRRALTAPFTHDDVIVYFVSLSYIVHKSLLI